MFISINRHHLAVRRYNGHHSPLPFLSLAKWQDGAMVYDYPLTSNDGVPDEATSRGIDDSWRLTRKQWWFTIGNQGGFSSSLYSTNDINGVAEQQ